MPIRDDILRLAEWWADPGEYKPWPEELISFFEVAEAEQAPSYAEAQKSLTTLSTGAFVGGAVKHWCGIFACHVLREAGLNVRWTLLGGKIVGKSANQVKYVPGNQGLRPGDVAMIPKANHHFIVTGVDYGSNTLWSVDGNTSGQMIRSLTKQVKYSSQEAATKTIYGYYRVLA